MAVAWDSQPVVSREGLLIGRVVRVMPAEVGQALAIQFEQAMSLDASVLDPAA